MGLHLSQVLVAFTLVLLNRVISVLLGAFSSRRKISWFQLLRSEMVSAASGWLWCALGAEAM